MKKKDVSKEWIDRELEQIQTRLNFFKDQAKQMDAQRRAIHAKHVAEVEQRIAMTKMRLLELDGAHSDGWEQLVDGVENIWKVLQSSLEDAVSHFKD